MSLFGKNQRDEPQAGEPSEPVKSPEPRKHVPERKPQPGRAPFAGHGGREEMANVGQSIAIKGDLTGDEDLQVVGSVEGRIDLPNNELTVGPEGKVKAEVNAKSVVVEGHITGNVTAVDRVELRTSGVVDGDVRAPRLVVQEGAVLNGTVEMGDAKKKPLVETTPKVSLGGEAPH